MPPLHLPSTPERLIAGLRRSDSKDPSTTCRGLTTAGKQCRNPLKLSLATSPSQGSPNPAGRRKDTLKINDEAKDGIVTVGDHGEVVFYCWRHKDQTPIAATNTRQEGAGPKRREPVKLEARTSVDTLVERLGGLDVGEKGRHGRKDGEAERRRRNKPQQARRPNSKPQQQQRGFWANLCCTASQHLDVTPATKARSKPVQPMVASIPIPRSDLPAFSNHLRPDLKTKPAAPSSQTQTLLSRIPPHLSPQTTSLLLSELAKPASEKDEEGYIYIFWLQDNVTVANPNGDPSPLSPPQTPQAKRGRRTSEIVRQASVTGLRQDAGVPKILLKIGRANNVHRRMHEWARQCGHTPTLIRWYPYVPSSSSHSSPVSARGDFASLPRNSPLVPPSPVSVTTGRKVPHVHRVERLIHIELGDQRVIHHCKACGKEHREWFEVEATRKGVKAVDTIVKRWVAWADERSEL